MYEIVHENGKVIAYNDLNVFLGVIESLLSFAEKFFVKIGKGVETALMGLHDLLERKGITIAFTANCEPAARDYVAPVLLGAATGAVIGAAVGGATWLLLGDLFFPGLGTALFISSLGGAAVGGAAGAAAVVWGLEVHFEGPTVDALAMSFGKAQPG